MRDVVLNILGTQTVDGQNDTVKMTACGKMGIKNGKLYISYDDSASFGVEGVTTILKIDGEKQVTMSRTGGVGGRLTVEKGQRHLCHYDTPEGSMMIGIFGESIHNSVDLNGGKLSMSYSLDINSKLLSRNKIEIEVSEVK